MHEARATQADYEASQKRETYFCFYVRDHVRTKIFFLIADPQAEADLCMAFDPDEPAPVHEKIIGEKVLLSISIFFSSYFCSLLVS